MISTSPGRNVMFAPMSPSFIKVRKPHRYAQVLVALLAHDHGAVAGCELAQATDGDHHVEHGHVGAVGQRLRLLRLAHHAHLVSERSDETGDDHVDGRRADVLRERLLQVARQLARRLASGLHVLDQRCGDQAVRAHRDRHGELRVIPDEHLQVVARPDTVLGLHRCFWRRRIDHLGASTAAGEHHA